MLCSGLGLKVSILKIGPLKIKLNIRNKRIIVKDFIKYNGKNFYSNLQLNQITDNYFGRL